MTQSSRGVARGEWRRGKEQYPPARHRQKLAANTQRHRLTHGKTSHRWRLSYSYYLCLFVLDVIRLWWYNLCCLYWCFPVAFFFGHLAIKVKVLHNYLFELEQKIIPGWRSDGFVSIGWGIVVDCVTASSNLIPRWGCSSLGPSVSNTINGKPLSLVKGVDEIHSLRAGSPTGDFVCRQCSPLTCMSFLFPCLTWLQISAFVIFFYVFIWPAYVAN